jgi:cyanophycinase-like exopeptidase
MLARAALNGKVIAGISAGAIALFNDGMSDSHKYERKSEDESWDFTPVEGLGLIDATVTPHADSLKTPDNRPRYIHFMEMLANRQNGNVEYGLGIDENAALVAIDGLVRVVISKRSKRLHVIGGDRSMKDLDTPLRYLNSTRSDLPGSGITWSDFYRQLGK